jgi:hypothetical protein
VAIVLLAGLSGCGELYRYVASGKVGWALKKELRDKNSKEVEIAKLTDFAWDELVLFSPYFPTAKVCERLGLSPDECKSTIKSASGDDSEMLIVFRNQGKIVHVEMHFRVHGDFTPVAEQVLTPETATFTVGVSGKATSGADWLTLNLKASPSRRQPQSSAQ